MKYLVSLFIILSFQGASSNCDIDWTNGKFNAELSSSQQKKLQAFWSRTPMFVYGRITQVHPNPQKDQWLFQIDVIDSFKKTLPKKSYKVVTSLRSKFLEKNDLWVVPVVKVQDDTLVTGTSCGDLGIPTAQEAVFHSFQQLANFSKDFGRDQWLTCEKDEDCIFVKTCSCYRSMNLVYLTQFQNWKNKSKFLACKECEDEDVFTAKYLPVCSAVKICDKKLK